jgi:hypothetical protein
MLCREAHAHLSNLVVRDEAVQLPGCLVAIRDIVD